MKKTIASLYGERAGRVFKLIDPELLKIFPRLENVELTLSIIKRSGPRTFIQCNTPGGASTLKLISVSHEIEFIEKDERQNTVSSLLLKYLFHPELRPTKLNINCNGVPRIYEILPGFWEQTPTNIRLKYLIRFGTHFKIPGSWFVLEEIKE
jgi:hypothetical protein